MPILSSDLENAIKKAFPDAHIEMEDLVGDGDHWSVTVHSAMFAGKTRVQQHKMVYNALEGKVGGELHALQVKTKVLA